MSSPLPWRDGGTEAVKSLGGRRERGEGDPAALERGWGDGAHLRGGGGGGRQEELSERPFFWSVGVGGRTEGARPTDRLPLRRPPPSPPNSNTRAKSTEDQETDGPSVGKRGRAFAQRQSYGEYTCLQAATSATTITDTLTEKRRRQSSCILHTSSNRWRWRESTSPLRGRSLCRGATSTGR